MDQLEQYAITPNHPLVGSDRHDRWLRRTEDNVPQGNYYPLREVYRCLLEMDLLKEDEEDDFLGNFALLDINGEDHLHSSELAEFIRQQPSLSRGQKLDLIRDINASIKMEPLIDDIHQWSPSLPSPPSSPDHDHRGTKRRALFSVSSGSPIQRRRRRRHETSVLENESVLRQLKLAEEICSKPEHREVFSDMAFAVVSASVSSVSNWQPDDEPDRVRITELITEMGLALPGESSMRRDVLMHIGWLAKRNYIAKHGKPPRSDNHLDRSANIYTRDDVDDVLKPAIEHYLVEAHDETD